VFAIPATSVLLTAFIALLSFSLCAAAFFCARVQVFKKPLFPLLMGAAILVFWYTLRGKTEIFIFDS
jgi:hypothetical protein